MVEAEEVVKVVAVHIMLTHVTNLAATAHMPTMAVAMMVPEAITETVIETEADQKDNQYEKNI
jgi:hypothetical protein